MKVGVLGAGSLGLVYSAFLSAKSDCVLLTRRAEQAAAISTHGITVCGLGEPVESKVTASADPTILNDRDLVIVLTKAQDAKSAAEAVAAHAPLSCVLTMQSGLGPLDIFNEHCSKERVIGGISYLGAKRTSDTTVEIGASLRTVIGEQDGTLSKRIRSIGDLLQDAGFDVETSSSITKLTWDKMVIIVAQQALSALTNNTFGQLRQSSEATLIVKQLLAELRAVAATQGVLLGDDLLERVHANWSTLPNHRSSMWQDLQTSGKSTEIDFINGAVVRLGKAHNIPTPTNSAIDALIKLSEKGDRNVPRT